MKQGMMIKRMLTVVAVILLGLFVGVPGCEPEDKVADHPPTDFSLWGDVFPDKSDGCVDGQDGDLDYMADRYGVPAHCTIGLPKKTTNLGSFGTLYAVGWYDYPTSDTYTVTVTTAGGSGVAAVSVTSVLGNNSPTNAVVTVNRPLYIGSRGVVIIFTEQAGQFNLVNGETWTISVKDVNTNCQMWPDMGCFLPTSKTEVEACGNGIDDDLDGKNDTADTQCSWACTTTSVPDSFWISESFAFVPQCIDGIDNDGDGTIDLADPDCGGSNCVPFE